MNILGIITEYNPFHYGHLYHLNKARELTGSDRVICVMNGNFVQRGEAAVFDKWLRTRMALANGVDMV
ncbi:MAG: nucleotidyltransferase family protein, partial [Halanaerobiaceae bacterium]|nr:nucleotidyltransferase family protein [Halanaerobiaceae bacterium]